MTTGTRTLIIAGIFIAIVLIPGGSADAATLIEGFESFSPTAYIDAGTYAIGYGTHYNYNAGRPVIASDVIDQSTALKWLNLVNAENSQLLADHVTVHLTPGQKKALLSFIYNIGSGSFLSSTLLRKLNSGAPISEVADEFDRWIYSDGEKNDDLVIRRAKEKAIFLS